MGASSAAGYERGLQASVDGFAHQLVAAGILMKRYQNVSLVDLPLSPYDAIIVLKERDGEERIIRLQVKTCRSAVSFIGGSRGGADRTYKSDVKRYRQSTKTSDVVVGVHPSGQNSFDLYFVPTILVEELGQGSISLGKIEALKNNYEMLEHCRDREFVIEKCLQYGVLKAKPYSPRRPRRSAPAARPVRGQ